MARSVGCTWASGALNVGCWTVLRIGKLVTLPLCSCLIRFESAACPGPVRPECERLICSSLRAACLRTQYNLTDEAGSSCCVPARLPGCVRGFDYRGRWTGDQDSGRSCAPGYAGLSMRESHEISGPGLFAGAGAVSNAKSSGERHRVATRGQECPRHTA